MEQKQKTTKNSKNYNLVILLNMQYGNSNGLQCLQMRWQYGGGVLQVLVALSDLQKLISKD